MPVEYKLRFGDSMLAQTLTASDEMKNYDSPDLYLEHLGREIDMHPDDSNLRVRRVIALRNLRSPEASQALEEGKRKFPSDYRFPQLEVVDMVLQGNVAGAIENLRRIVD